MTHARKLTLALVLGALLVPALASVASANKTQLSVLQDDRVLLDPAQRDRALNDIDALGVDVVRTQVSWARVAANGWTAYDGLVDGARARGLSVIATLTGPGPASASQCTPQAGNCKLSPARFQQFVTEAGRHFGARVRTWTLWNEPNVDSWMKPQYARSKGRTYIYAARRYRDLYRAGVKGLQASGHGKDRILLGDLSATGSKRAIAPVSFYRDLLCIDSKGRALKGTAASIRGCKGFKKLVASGVAHHPYTPAAACSPRCRGGSRDITIASLGRLATVLDQGVRRGRVSATAAKNIWLTEFSFQGRKGGAVTPTEQGAYTNWSEWIAFKSPRLRSYAQYELQDDPNTANAVFSSTGLRDGSWAPKPAYTAFRVPIFVVKSGRGHVAVFGGVRPGGRHKVKIQAKNKAGRFVTVKTVTSNSRGYVNVRLGTRKSWRLEATVGGATYTSRTSGVR